MENPAIHPTPPDLPGLTWQAITLADLDALATLAGKCEQVDGGLALLNEPVNLRERYFPDAPGSGIGAFDTDGQLVACAKVHLVSNSGTERGVILGLVQPEWRNKGLGTFLIRWSQAQAQSLFTAGAENRVLRIATETLNEPSNRLYRAHGFEPVFEELVMEYDLRLPLPDYPPLPDISFTAWQPELAEQFFQAYHTAFRERPGFPGYSSAEWISDYNENENFKPEWSFLARAGSLPVGFVTASHELPGGYIIQIGVIPEQRRRGLASALMVESMRPMKESGASAVQLCVNLNNPGAEQTYASLGFVTAGRRARYERTAEP